jgi:hypothetical protein
MVRAEFAAAESAAGVRISSSTSGSFLLSGYGCDEQGPYLVLDQLEGSPWARNVVRVRDRTFTFSRCRERRCTGRHDLATGRGAPCPEESRLDGSPHEQCGACFAATGFNPAFYNAPQVSEQQRMRNLEPHVVYVVSFGLGALKVGMTYAPRHLSRPLEQGARLAAVIASLPNAGAARELEEAIVRGFDVAESVRSARKRALLSMPLSLAAARRELAANIAAIAARHPVVREDAPIRELDPYYLGAQRLPSTLVDLSDTEPASISGRCLGMIGDVLVTTQGQQCYMLSIGGCLAHRIELDEGERENRFIGQLGLPF